MIVTSLSSASLVEMVWNLNVVTYANVAASAMFVYDYALTLHLEVDLVWRSDWSAVKVLYLIQRYTPFVDTLFLLIYRSFSLNETRRTCQQLTYAYAVINMLGMMASEALFAICIWALWRRTMRVAIILCVAFIVVWIPSSAFLYIFTENVGFVDSTSVIALNHNYRGCFIISRDKDMIWTWVGLAVWDALALLGVGLPMVKDYHGGTGLRSLSSVANVIYRDGTMYYLFVFVMSIINIVTNIVLPPDLRIITAAMTRCIHSMLASRVLLHLRAHAKKDNVTIETIRSNLVFGEDEENSLYINK